MPTTEGGRVVLAEQHRPGRRRKGLTALVVLALLAGLAWAGWSAARTLLTGLVPASCTATAEGRSTSWSPEQAANAATIAAVSVKRGLPARAATIAIATAMQESKLRNLTVGDRDSVGLFQQRPSQGWGSTEEILDPVYASTAFYERLVKVDGYLTRPLTDVAQQIQRSAYPSAYAQHEDEARILASVFTGHSPAGLVCALHSPGKAGEPAATAAALERALGVSASVTGTGGDARVTAQVSANDALAWAAGAWAVAHAHGRAVNSVQVRARVWDRSSAAWGPAPSTPEVSISFIELS